MKILPTNAERAARMSDVTLAHNLVAEIAGHCWRGKGDMLDRVHVAISKRYPGWTRRRVRAFWHKEAAGVRYHEMIELADVARQEREAREMLDEARRSHAQFVERTARLATALATQDEDFHRDAIGALGGLVGRMDMSGADL